MRGFILVKSSCGWGRASLRAKALRGFVSVGELSFRSWMTVRDHNVPICPEERTPVSFSAQKWRLRAGLSGFTDTNDLYKVTSRKKKLVKVIAVRRNTSPGQAEQNNKIKGQNMPLFDNCVAETKQRLHRLY